MVCANSSALLSDFLKRDAELGNAILKLKQLARAEFNDHGRARINAQIRHLEDRRGELDGERVAFKASMSTMTPPSAQVLAEIEEATTALGKQIAIAQTADAIVTAVAAAFTAWNSGAAKPG
jgi:hypothetical protein